MKQYNKIKNYITYKREPFYKIVKKYINEASLILDIGAGDASFARFLNNDYIYMIDGNKNTVKKMQKKYYNYHYAKLPNLPFSEHKFDIIHCSHVIEHLTPLELYNLLINCNKCIKDNGLLIFSAPLNWEHFWDDLSHIRPYNPKIFEKYLCCSSKNSTRETISTNYEIIELQYRYRLKNIGEDLIYVKNKFILKFTMNLISKVGLRKIEKTGYTIILKKLPDNLNK